MNEATTMPMEITTSPINPPTVHRELFGTSSMQFGTSSTPSTSLQTVPVPTSPPQKLENFQQKLEYAEGSQATMLPRWTIPKTNRQSVTPPGLHTGFVGMFVKKHRDSGVVGRRGTGGMMAKKGGVVVNVLRKQKFRHAFGKKRSREEDRPKCNSAALWNIMEQKMSASPSASKQLLYSAILARFPGRIASIVCSRYSFSYIVVTSPIYCEHRKTPLTCFAFLQP